jgi:prevent-host-death family protein
MTCLSVSELRSQLSEVLSTVAFRGERIIIQRNGRDMAALVPMSDLLFLTGEDEEPLEVGAAPGPEAQPAEPVDDDDAPLTDAEVAEIERVIGIRPR